MRSRIKVCVPWNKETIEKVESKGMVVTFIMTMFLKVVFGIA
jgi:hypothetical protein